MWICGIVSTYKVLLYIYRRAFSAAALHSLFDAALEMETFRSISYHLQSRSCRCILDSLRLVLSTSAKMVVVIYPLKGDPWHIVFSSVIGIVLLYHRAVVQHVCPKVITYSGLCDVTGYFQYIAAFRNNAINQKYNISARQRGILAPSLPSAPSPQTLQEIDATACLFFCRKCNAS